MGVLTQFFVICVKNALKWLVDGLKDGLMIVHLVCKALLQPWPIHPATATIVPAIIFFIVWSWKTEGLRRMNQPFSEASNQTHGGAIWVHVNHG
jgi:hypothetical protein